MEEKEVDIWKRFKEVIGFIHDNKGVIQSLENQKLTASTESAKATLDEQIEEVHVLLQHHQEELLDLLEKGKKTSDVKLTKEFEALERAIQKLDTKSLEKHVEQIQQK